MSKLAKLLVTGLATGYLPLAPGSWASLAACAVYVGVAAAASGRQVCLTGTMLVIAVAAALGCGLLGGRAEAAFGKRDPRQVTLDEWAGQAVALVLLPLGTAWAGRLLPVAAAFVAFRLFDISKPPPCRWMEKLPGGWGIVADDLVAGVYANVVVQVAFRFVWPLH